MNDNILRNTPSSDPGAMEEGCRRELTRTYSDSSDITVESSHQTANARPGQAAGWTNENHNAYLNSLEASFVQQLHYLRSSIGLHGRCSQENISGPCSSQLLSANTRYSSDQDGNRLKIKCEVNETLFEDAADSHGMLESPRICHFTSVGKLQTSTSFDALEHNVLSDEGVHSRDNSTFSCEPAGSTEQRLDRHLCHPSLDDSATAEETSIVGPRRRAPLGATFAPEEWPGAARQGGAHLAVVEVSDQNFVDEDRQDKSSHGFTAKRLKTAGVDALNNDKVSLLGRLNVKAISRASLEREELVHQEFLSEHPQSSASPRSNMHYFLRGS
ncbi:hypothetical protein EZV62_011295 [Acer yangbiense]|uniref:Uncharacterized protein n=1 Tax=Acer yangbiense TaxID=1000413 RepID=A0A5C7I4V4_9ROSI|nr:hypothetical protein EZV62_011295 [Acer yangbiense]